MSHQSNTTVTTYLAGRNSSTRTAMHLYKTARRGARAAERHLLEIGWNHIQSNPHLARQWDLVTTVTSTKNPDRPELARIATILATRLNAPHGTILRTGPGRIDRGTYDHDGYLAPRGLHGQDILLVEDTWVTGAHATAAAAALEQQGANVTLLCIAQRLPVGG